MLHDGKCERIAVVAGIASEIGLSPGEYEAMVSEFMVPMVACRCHHRFMRRVGPTDEELRQDTSNWIYRTRGRQIGGIVAAVASCRMKVEGSSSLTAAELIVRDGGLKSTSGESGKVIAVDFRNRRRAD